VRRHRIFHFVSPSLRLSVSWPVMSTTSTHPGLLIVLVGPSGVGKSTISRKLAEKMHLKYIVSATTRHKTEKDADGKTYDYLEPKDFFHKLEAGEFLEYASVWDEYYGTPKRPTLDYLANGEDVLLEIDVQGALQVRFQYPDVLMIFIMPPDEASLLHRLRERGRDTEESIEKRFRGAKREIWMAKGSRAFDDMVINDNVDRAVDEIARLIRQKKSPGGF
jgi:guanylate kinase